MRMNGGIIGKLNKPSNYSANGVWKWSERYANILDYRFPTYYPGFDLTNLINKQTQYTANSFVVSAQEATMQAIFFKPDGTKLYVMGSTSDNVHQYSLSTAWNITTASYDNIKFAIAAQDTTPTGLFFKPDGTKMYVSGSSNDNVSQYSLSTAWNVATATYDSVNFSIAAQDGGSHDLFFKPDGTKMYILGNSNDKVFQYSLSSPWVVSSASYDNISYSIATQDPLPYGLTFKSDGTKMYMSGGTDETIFQYSLSSAWNVATASPDGANNNISVALYDVDPSALFFKPDGNKLFVGCGGASKILEYNVESWNIQKTPGLSNSLSISAQDTSPDGIAFKPDGTKMYMIGSATDRIQQYSLSTPWNISTASIEANANIVAQTTACDGFYFKPDGTKLYVTDSSFVVYQYSLSTAWNISTLTYDSISRDYGTDAGAPTIAFNPTGTKIYAGGNIITQYTANSAWNIANPISDSKSYSIVSNTGPWSESSIGDFIISADGSKLWALGTTADRIYQYTFGTSWDISTLSYSKSYYIGDIDNVTVGLYFKPNGEKLYVLGSTNDVLYELTLSG